MEQADFDHAIDDEYSWTSVLEDLQHSVHVRSITSLTTNLQKLECMFLNKNLCYVDSSTISLHPDLTVEYTKSISQILVFALMHPSVSQESIRAVILRIVIAAVRSVACPNFSSVCTKLLLEEARHCFDQKSLLNIIKFMATYSISTVQTINPWTIPDWLVDTATVYSVCFEKLASIDKKNYRRKGIRSFEAVIHEKPHQLSSFFMGAFGNQDDIAYSVLSFGITADICARLCPEDFEGGLKRNALQVYVRDILGAKVPPSPYVTLSFHSLLSQIKAIDFSEEILPPIERLLLKNPDSILPTVSAFLASVTLDLSNYVEKVFLPPLLRQLRSAKEDIRGHAVEAIRRLALKCNDVQVLGRLGSELVSVLSGKSGILALWYQRHCVAQALSNVAKVCIDKAISPILPSYSEIILSLMPLVEKETQEEVRSILHVALVEWASLCSTLDSVILKVLRTFSGSMDSSKSAGPVLQALSHMLVLKSELGILYEESLVKKVFEKMETALGRPGSGVQIEACLALQLAAQLASLGHFTEFRTSQPWAILKDFNTHIYPSSSLDNVDVSSLIAVCNAAKYLSCVAAAKNVAGYNKSHAYPCLASHIAKCLIYQVQNVVSAANGAVVAIKKASPLHGTSTLLKSLKLVIDEYAVDKKTSSASIAELKRNKSITSGRIQAAISIITSGSTVFDSSMYEPLLLLCHHPLTAQSWKEARKIWRKTILNSIGHNEVTLGSEICTAIVNALLSPSASTRLSAELSVGTLCLDCGDQGLQLIEQQILPAVLNSLQLAADILSKLSAHETALALAPSGVLFGSVQGSKENGASASNRGQVSKNVTRKGKDVEEMEWEERMRKEVEAKRAATQAGTKTAEMNLAEKQLLEEEEALRKRVSAISEQAKISLHLVAFAFRNFGYKLSSSVILKTVALLEDGYLLKSTFLAEEARICLGAVVSNLDDLIRHLGTCLVDSIALLQIGGTSAVAESNSAAILLNGLSEALFDKGNKEVVEDGVGASDLALASTTFSILLPIFSAIIEDPPSPLLAQIAVRLISAHTDMSFEQNQEDSVWRACVPEMLRISLLALSKYRRFDNPNPADVVAALCVGVDLPLDMQKEWPLLLGDDGLLSQESYVRCACLQAISMMSMTTDTPRILLDRDCTYNTTVTLESRLWLLKFDLDHETSTMASATWAECSGGAPPSKIVPWDLIPLLAHTSETIRLACSKALASALAANAQIQEEFVSDLIQLYHDNTPIKEQSVDVKLVAKSGKQHKFATAAAEEAEAAALAVDSGWSKRRGVALALEACATSKCLKGDLIHIFTFFVNEGLADDDELVRAAMVQAGVAMIKEYGQGQRFLPMCEAAVAAPTVKGENIIRADRRRQGAVVFLGAAAAHIDPTDIKVVAVAKSLSEALSIPSEAVQIAISDCLVPLCKTAALKQASSELIADLVNRCVGGGGSYGDRRGAAMGLAAMVKGIGIGTLKKEGIMTKLEEACSSVTKGGGYQGKEGALFAYECLCVRLGLLFEPYVIVLLPLLLRSFSDSSDKVRNAAENCSRSIMSKLSAHGVKLVLPAILQSLSDPSWRTKQVAIQFLGSMAYCAPKQLSSCLPMIVPKLTAAFADTHPKVREAGKRALEDVGSVIRNPEVASLSGILMDALSDAKHTKEALEALLACEFMHSIDAPSMALVMPVLVRGLRDRSAESKRRAALIIGSITAMAADPADIVPYLDAILPGLQATVKDPIPDVRATSAKAMGALAGNIGEARLPDLLSWLQGAVKEDSSSPERSGAAQALSEVLVALGSQRAADTLSDMLPLAKHPKSHVREGVMWLVCFMPGAMGRSFIPLIDTALPVVIAGLSDDAEGVREVSMRAGQVLVKKHGRLHANLLLPSLEAGLVEDDWRIRQSSVVLLGDLLFLIGDTKEAGVNDGEDAGMSNKASQAIEGALGSQKRNSVLAALYLARSDSSSMVRQKALQVWKTIVPQTPRALREIMPLLIIRIVEGLASKNIDRRTVAAHALGDLVRKLGDTVLPEVVPFLRKGLQSGDEHTREGVCMGLAELVESASKRQVEEFIGTIALAVQEALCDASPGVREQSGHAFQILYNVVGFRAIEAVLPSLLSGLGEEDEMQRNKAVLGLQQVLCVKSRELLSYFIPLIITKPITPQKSRAIGAMAQVTTIPLYLHLFNIVPALVSELSVTELRAEKGNDSCDSLLALEELKKAANEVVSNISEAGMTTLCTEMVSLLEHENAAYRKWAAELIEMHSTSSKLEFLEQVPILLRGLLMRLNDVDASVLMAACKAMGALNARVGPELLVTHLSFTHNIISSTVSAARHRKGGVGNSFQLPGLNISKGLEPWLPMYQQGLLYGSPEIRELAAIGIGQLVEVTSYKYLQPFLIKMTGPLIRIVGDRFPSSVRAAILHTLGLLVSKGGASLKPFVPQLMTTFVKALSDPGAHVREKGLSALTQLVPLITRMDPLVNELAQAAASSDNELSVRITVLEALKIVLSEASSKVTQAGLTQVISHLISINNDEDKDVRIGAAVNTGLALSSIPIETLGSVMNSYILAPKTNYLDEEFKVICISSMAEASSLSAATLYVELLPILQQAIGVNKTDTKGSEYVIEACCRGLGNISLAVLKQFGKEKAKTVFTQNAPYLASVLGSDVSSIGRVAAASSVKRMSKAAPELTRLSLQTMVPALVKALKDSTPGVKSAVERTLLNLLEINSEPTTLAEYVGSSDTPSDQARFIRDYARKVLSKLPVDSDEEI